jgi:hypothetical protein
MGRDRKLSTSIKLNITIRSWNETSSSLEYSLSLANQSPPRYRNGHPFACARESTKSMIDKEPSLVDKTQVKTFPLRLPRSTRIEAGKIAAREGISLNQFIALAVAEKLARMGLMQPDAIT